jgi:hypothetical protein
MTQPVTKQHEMTFEGRSVAFYTGGSGPPLLLIHGSGPGASSIGNWRSVLGPLSESYEVFAMDLLGFGLSDRKAGPPYFDFPMWVEAGAGHDAPDWSNRARRHRSFPLRRDRLEPGGPRAPNSLRC